MNGSNGKQSRIMDEKKGKKKKGKGKKKSKKSKMGY